jgi:hypothetical protein
MEALVDASMEEYDELDDRTLLTDDTGKLPILQN